MSGEIAERIRRRLALLFMVMAGLAVLSSTPALAFQLITREEAAAGVYQQRRYYVVPEGGPEITVIEPVLKPGTAVRSPMNIRVSFRPQQGAQIDVRSLRVTYLKLFGIDLTPRIAPYATVQGIAATNVEIPPGSHRIQIAIKDTLGRLTERTIEFVIQ
jgi:hypothetical protein